MGARPHDLEWVYVTSSNLERVAWEPVFEATAYDLDAQGRGTATEYEATDKGVLHIIFNPGGRAPRHYAYSEVPYSVYEGLLAAPSAGKYHHAEIKWKYPYTEL